MPGEKSIICIRDFMGSHFIKNIYDALEMIA